MKDVLKSLKILDTDGTLCLSSLSLAAALVLIAVQPGWEAITVFTLAILNFNAKKFFAFLKARKEAGDAERINAMDAEISALKQEFLKLNAAMTFKNIGRQ